MIAYIDAFRDRFRVEPISRVLQFAPSTYWSARCRPASGRSQRDVELKAEIARVHAENFGVYGVPTVWAQLNSEGHTVARCTVERLTREPGLRGTVRGRPMRTTVADPAGPRPRDLVERRFCVVGPNRLWVADLTYVRTWSGFVYVAFVTDAYSRRIMGWQASGSLRSDLALHAPSGNATGPATASPGWSITATAAVNVCPSVTASASPRTRLSARWGPAATAATTR